MGLVVGEVPSTIAPRREINSAATALDTDSLRSSEEK